VLRAAGSARNDGGVADRPTLQTVADHLGVSRATVSNAYNRPDQLSPALRERVLAAARDLGYSGPDPAARGLRLRRTGVVGVLLGESLTYAFTDPAAAMFLEGVATEGEKTNTSMLLIPSPVRDAGDQTTAVRNAVVDGFCIYCVSDSRDQLGAVIERRLPTVLIEGDPIAGAARVDIDQFSGASAAAAHLEQLGHERVGILAERLQVDGYRGWVSDERLAAATEPVTRGRVLGYRDSFPRAPIYEVRGNRFEAGYQAATIMLDEHPEVTAILAETDMLAFGTQRVAAERGLRVPEDLSIVGFDDIPPAARNVPPLTTVRQPLRQKGEVAYQLLGELLAGGPPRTVMLPVELIVRESTAPPRSPSPSPASD
jgi:DNA-binding LacI/PurR family transcriptional regulator